MRTRSFMPLSRRLRYARLSISSALRIRFGRLVLNCSRLAEAYSDYYQSKDRPRLGPDDIVKLRASQIDEVDGSVDRRSKPVTDENITSGRDIYTDTANIIFGLLTKEKLGVAVNIGARVDVIFSYLSSKYPETEFISIDIQDNLEEHNRLLPRSNNWRLVSGYALEVLERDSIKPDLAVFTSTACLFTNKELRSYLETMRARFICLNEPFIPPIERPWHAMTPDQIDPFDSLISSTKPTNPAGRLFYVHNYLRILESFGYEIVFSELRPQRKNPHKEARHVVLANIPRPADENE